MNQPCPNCGSNIPYYAFRCKHCFHDLQTSTKNRKTPVALFAGLFVLGLVAMQMTQYIAESRESTNYVFDQESSAMLIMQKTKKGLNADRLPFTKINSIEHVTGGEQAMYEIWVSTGNGDRFLVNKSQSPLTQQGQSTARLIGKKLTETNNSHLGK